jgi:pimeloyl-ACP methyl ester carboxylesterase
MREAASSIPDAHTIEFDVGHHVHRAAPEAFASAVLDFLGYP